MAQDVCMATWARSQPGLLVITGNGTGHREIRVKPPPGVPALTLLAGTGWLAYPGAQWQEGDCTPGVWQCAVFAFPTKATG